jgi:iron-sulfur cluster insertion protein
MTINVFNPTELVSVTESAKAHLLHQIGDSIGVSLGLMPNGCAGFEYDWEVVSEVPDDYTELLLGDKLLLIDNMSSDFLVGSIIDLKDEGIKGKTLTVTSPKALGSCGCGESVTFDV